MKFLIACFINIACFSLFVSAQQIVIKGAIYRRISSEKLAEVFITNKRTKGVAIADNLGDFSINATVGDTLVFTKKGFTPQMQEATKYGMIVYMQPEMQLDEVRIVGQTRKQELKEVMSDYRKQGTFYNGNPPVLSMLTSPITGLYELFGKTPGRAKRFAAYSKGELEATEVDRRYNRPLVMRVTGLTDNDSTAVTKFMQYYRPSYEDLKIWADYDLIQKIKAQYEYFKKNGDRDNLQKLY
ncbi:hypothetical protein [Mucilaginibacter phyllosphaerae]|uniref:Carboxypeptidase-like regulatory domain-containing protein n=1 Tax=Mucilaginibacter phyllosphaerae TaxID=1812349 RepID=A0A4Y8A9T5_9SPHI|nr:hypothetical protein [Mucilaginibacter phyllosphaerae]MBB3969811.1 hypothetical protein [Mucilaginibacter phyllosphaerae]TEW65188.1 hypothetical protein E2R65_14840 [Mucilaginibacter phyllosphaerae]